MNDPLLGRVKPRLSPGADVLWVEPKYFDKTKRAEFEKYLMWLVENRPGEADSSQITVSTGRGDSSQITVSSTNICST